MIELFDDWCPLRLPSVAEVRAAFGSMAVIGGGALFSA